MTVYKKTSDSYLGFFLVAFFAVFQTSLGSILPYLKSEMEMSYKISGLFPSAFALGMIISGSVSEYIINTINRKNTIIIGITGMTISYILMILIPQTYFSITMCFITGFTGTLSFISAQALLSDIHGKRRDTALSEANIYAGLFMAALPFIIGTIVKNNFNWRYSIFILFAVFIPILFMKLNKFNDTFSIIELKTTSKPEKPKLSFYLYLILMYIAISIEWCILFWTPEYLTTHTGLTKSNASIVFGIFLVFYIPGRFLGSKLTLIVKTELLYYFTILIATLSFPVFYISQNKILGITALMIVAIGIANFFPLNLAVIMNKAEGRSNFASGKATSAAGAAILTAPFILGYAGDNLGLYTAYGIIFILLIILLVSAFPYKIFKRHE